jgi:hypothetical protein
VPSVVKVIGGKSFYKNTYVNVVTLPDSITSIKSFAFCDCEGLELINIPSSVTEIGLAAFYNCSNVTVHCMTYNKPAGWNRSWDEGAKKVIWIN